MGALPGDPAALAALLPDTPRWVEARDLLLRGSGRLRLAEHGDGALVVDPDFPWAAQVGRVDGALLAGLALSAAEDFELIVDRGDVAAARAGLPGWGVDEVRLHALARPWPAQAPAADGVLVCDPPWPRWLRDMPDDVRRYGEVAHAVAVRVLDGSTVTVCSAAAVTETLWDVGIDTLEGHRRCGHAMACFAALATHMAARGRQPVWAAYADNAASLRLAAQLGFREVDRVAVLSPGDGADGR